MDIFNNRFTTHYTKVPTFFSLETGYVTGWTDWFLVIFRNDHTPSLWFHLFTVLNFCPCFWFLWLLSFLAHCPYTTSTLLIPPVPFWRSRFVNSHVNSIFTVICIFYDNDVSVIHTTMWSWIPAATFAVFCWAVRQSHKAVHILTQRASIELSLFKYGIAVNYKMSLKFVFDHIIVLFLFVHQSKPCHYIICHVPHCI